VFGYIVLLFSPLVLLSQVAVFIIFGLFGALSFVLVLLPRLNKKLPNKRKITVNTTVLTAMAPCADWIKTSSLYKKPIFTFFCLVIVVSLLKQPFTFNDDVRLLNSSPPWLLENEKHMAKIMGYQGSQRLIIRAETSQALLEKQESVINMLTQHQQGLHIKGLADVLPSIKQQKIYYQQLTQAQANFTLGLNSIGLRDDVGEFNGLTYTNFTQGPLKNLAQLYLAPVTYSDGLLAYTLWLDVQVSAGQGGQLNPQNIEWITTQPGVDLYDRAQAVSTALSAYRQGLLSLLMVAFIIVALILWRFYGLKKGLWGFAAIAFSAFGALLLSQCFLGYLNIFNLLAVLLILALAVDYVIFYQEKGIEVATFLAVSLSAISSALVFGILVFSITPAVKSFGLTVMLGIVFIFIFAPLSVGKQRKNAVITGSEQ
jgi:predicted exporter